MEKLNLKSVVDYVEKNIGVFHQKRIKCVDGLKLKYSVPQVKTTLRKKLCINHYATSCS